MERDLHDGAQQRLLALGYDLRVALELAETTGTARPPARCASRSTARSPPRTSCATSRTGSSRSELTASGLEAALEALADVRPLRLAVDAAGRTALRPEVETAAYAVVVEAVDAADGLVVAAVSERDGAVHVGGRGSRGVGGAAAPRRGPRPGGRR